MHSDGFSISVVIPCHRDESSLALAVQTASHQSFEPLEIIVINDDDKPLSSVLQKRLEAVSDRVRILETGFCSGSPAMPRNIGIEAARGRYIAFLDADDLWLPGHLQSMLSVWQKFPFQIVHGHQLCWGNELSRPFFLGGLSTQNTPRSTFNRLLCFGNSIFLSSVGAPRSLLLLYPFDVNLIWEDFDLWLRLAASGHSFANTMSCTTLYQIRARSRSWGRTVRRKAAKQFVANHFPSRPFIFLPPWLLRNLYF